MRKKSVTAEIAAYIRENYLEESGKSIARRFDIGAGAVQRFMRKEGLKVSAELINKFRSEAVTGTTTFTPEEDNYIREHYLKMPIKRIADHIGRSYTGIMGRLKRLNLTIPAEIVERNRRESYIKAGNEPFNKGRKQTEWMSEESIQASAKSRYAKGNIPVNTASGDGEISIRDIKRNAYKFIRIRLAKWVLLHKHLWEEKNGPVPDGHCLWAKDGNSLNEHPDNWELITRKENRIRNSGTVSLPDHRVAFYLSPKDKELRAEIEANHPELISIKRKQLLLNRAINEKL